MDTRRLVMLCVVLLGGMLACNLESGIAGPASDPTQVFLAAGQTIAAVQTEAVRLTRAANQSDPGNPQEVRTDSPAQPAEGGETPEEPAAPAADTPTMTPSATWTSTFTNTPTITLTPIPCHLAKFIADVNVPDNWTTTTNDHFNKKWSVQNVGSCAWTSGYKVKFDHGDAMGAPAEWSITSGTVAPGQTVEISVDLLSPASEGTYQGWYRLYTPANEMIPFTNSANHWFWLKIIVDNPEPSVSVSVISATASVANGTSGSATANCPAGSVVVSGGFEVPFNLRTKKSSKLGNGWTALVSNQTGSTKSITVYAVCLTKSGAATDQVGTSGTATPGNYVAAHALCPSGSVVTGGGFFANSPSTNVYSSRKVDNGWKVWMINDSGADASVSAYAVCLTAAGASTADGFAEYTIPAGTTGGGRIGCAPGKYMVGGGFSGGTYKYYPYISAPFSNAEWQNFGYNTDLNPKTLKSYAVCLAF